MESLNKQTETYSQANKIVKLMTAALSTAGDNNSNDPGNSSRELMF